VLSPAAVDLNLRTLQTVTLNGKAISFPTRLFINNEFVESVSGKTFAAIDPATEQEICQLAEGTPKPNLLLFSNK
jgi:hypothetical protein